MYPPRITRGLMAGAPQCAARPGMSPHGRDGIPGDEDPPSAKRTRVGGDAGPSPSTHTPCVSVLMPCRNAMPWLPDCVASVLSQVGLETHGGLELIAVDDSSTDGSREWLDALAAALATRGDDGNPAEDPSATAAPSSTSSDDPPGAGGFPVSRLEAWESDKFTPLTVEQVVSRVTPGNQLVVLDVKAHGPSGQGKALNAAYAAARGELVGEMESDDLRPPNAFATLRASLIDNPRWDCATSTVQLCGWRRPGMERWIDWQNAQLTPSSMRKGRFVEIPALRGSGLYRRSALERVAMRDGREDDVAVSEPAEYEPAEVVRPYRDLWVLDGVVADCAHDADPAYELTGRKGRRPSGWWPVDADFWQRWFVSGLVAGKVDEPLYLWRQYPAQSTRTHARCSLTQLRRCKAHFLMASGGPARGRAVQVWGTGDTLRAWVDDLRALLSGWDGSGFRRKVRGVESSSDEKIGILVAAAEATVRAIEYRPGEPISKKRLEQEDTASREALVSAGVELDRHDVGSGPVRLFAFGMEKARSKVAKTFPGFDEAGEDHWFVA